MRMAPMANNTTGGPAFPTPSTSDDGMTLRDYFAKQAMAALIQVGMVVPQEAGETYEFAVAHDAYEFADAMLKVRNE